MQTVMQMIVQVVVQVVVQIMREKVASSKPQINQQFLKQKEQRLFDIRLYQTAHKLQRPVISSRLAVELMPSAELSKNIVL